MSACAKRPNRDAGSSTVRRPRGLTCPRGGCYRPAVMPRVLLHPTFRRLAGCALVAGATWGCASDESARRAVAELASVQRELAEMRTMHQGNTRELAELGSRMRGLESEVAGLATEIRSAAPELTRARAALEEADAALRARVTRSAPPAPAPAQ